ncbi:MAG: hypothetical protein K0B16_14180 [Burkholderiaceae bacterium]|nr:hypothetical protein [Burkholderiaceae bacterium]
MRMRLRELIAPVVLMVLGVCASAPLMAVQDGMLPAPAGAEDAVAPSDTGSVTSETAQSLESTRDSVRSAAIWLASGVNSWFGDRPFKDGGKVSDGRLDVSLYKRQDQAVDLIVRFNANFKLPNLEEHTYLFTGRDNPREIITDKPVSFSRKELLQTQAEADRSFFAGIGRTLGDSVDFRIGFHGALKPYVQGRYRKSWQPSPIDVVDLRETVFLTIADRFGSTTALSYRHVFSPTLVGRWLSAATITQADNKFDLNTSVGLYKSLGGQRLMTLELLANGKQGTGVAVTDYGLQARWEQPVYKDWLLGEIVLGHFWPRPDANLERGSVWAVGTAMKIRF